MLWVGSRISSGNVITAPPPSSPIVHILSRVLTEKETVFLFSRITNLPNIRKYQGICMLADPCMYSVMLQSGFRQPTIRPIQDTNLLGSTHFGLPPCFCNYFGAVTVVWLIGNVVCGILLI